MPHNKDGNEPIMQALKLVVFENNIQSMRAYQKQGINDCFIDLEYMGKDMRQLGFDTDITPGTIETLHAISSQLDVTVWCRLNRYGDWTEKEIDVAIDAGADILVLPMIRSRAEVESFISLIKGRARICVMLETKQALDVAASIEGLPFDSAYFGLNDYMIDVGSDSIFDPMGDGTVKKARHILKNYKFGVAGMTDITKGTPIPSIQILHELERLRADFVFLRRSFKKDVDMHNVGAVVAALKGAWQESCARSDEARKVDNILFKDTLRRFSHAFITEPAA